jgi:hypothetical protein
MSDQALFTITDEDGTTAGAGIFWDKVRIELSRGASTYLTPDEADQLADAIRARAAQLRGRQALDDAHARLHEAGNCPVCASQAAAVAAMTEAVAR